MVIYLIYDKSPSIWDQSQLSSLIRLEMALKNREWGTNFPLKFSKLSDFGGTKAIGLLSNSVRLWLCYSYDKKSDYLSFIGLNSDLYYDF